MHAILSYPPLNAMYSIDEQRGSRVDKFPVQAKQIKTPVQCSIRTELIQTRSISQISHQIFKHLQAIRNVPCLKC